MKKIKVLWSLIAVIVLTACSNMDMPNDVVKSSNTTDRHFISEQKALEISQNVLNHVGKTRVTHTPKVDYVVDTETTRGKFSTGIFELGSNGTFYLGDVASIKLEN